MTVIGTFSGKYAINFYKEIFIFLFKRQNHTLKSFMTRTHAFMSTLSPPRFLSVSVIFFRISSAVKTPLSQAPLVQGQKIVMRGVFRALIFLSNLRCSL